MNSQASRLLIVDDNELNRDMLAAGWYGKATDRGGRQRATIAAECQGNAIILCCWT